MQLNKLLGQLVKGGIKYTTEFKIKEKDEQYES